MPPAGTFGTMASPRRAEAPACAHTSPVPGTDEVESAAAAAREAEAAVDAAQETLIARKSQGALALSAQEQAQTEVAQAAKKRQHAEQTAAAAARRASVGCSGGPVLSAASEAVLVSTPPWRRAGKRRGRPSTATLTRLLSHPRTADEAQHAAAAEFAEAKAQAAHDQLLLDAVRSAKQAEVDARARLAECKSAAEEARHGAAAAAAAAAAAKRHAFQLARIATAVAARAAKALMKTPFVSEDDDAALPSRRPSTPFAPTTPRGARVSTPADPYAAWSRAKDAEAVTWAQRVAKSAHKAAAGDARVKALRQERDSTMRARRASADEHAEGVALKRTSSLGEAEAALAEDAVRRGALAPPPLATMPSYAPLSSSRVLPRECSSRRDSLPASGTYLPPAFVVSETVRSYLHTPRRASPAAVLVGGVAAHYEHCAGLRPQAAPPASALHVASTQLVVSPMRG